MIGISGIGSAIFASARKFSRVTMAATFALVVTASHGQGFPTHVIRVIVPFSAGGSSDVIARNFTNQLSIALGQPVVIENRPGAATNIGSDAVANAAPDGYTLLLASAQMTINSVFGPIPKYDMFSAFMPVSMIGRLPFIIAARTQFPFETFGPLLAEARKNPGKYTIGTAQLEMFVELLKVRTESDFLHVPFRGGAESIVDTISGQVDMTMNLGPVLLPQVRAGKLKPVGVASSKRLDVFPSTPTFRELGFDYEVSYWYGLVAPAGTPKAIVDRLTKESRQIVESPGFGSFMRDNGGLVDASGPDEMRAAMEKEVAAWRELGKRVPALLAAGKGK